MLLRDIRAYADVPFFIPFLIIVFADFYFYHFY